MYIFNDDIYDRKGTVRMMDGADTNNMYEKMVLIYEEYISTNNIDEEKIIDTIKVNDTALDLAIGRKEASFVLLNKTTLRRILTIGTISLDSIQLNDDGTIPEAHQADIISTVLYDRAFGCESPKNLCRNMTNNFNDKLKVVVDMIKK